MMPALVHARTIPPMDAEAIAQVLALEEAVAKAPQIDMPTQHVFHAGLYARTIGLPSGCVLTGALIKIATLLIVSGDATVFTGAESIRLTGYHVLPASAGRKQAFVAHVDTCITMVFKSDATSVEEVEREFTDEHELLMSRYCGNDVVRGDVP